MAIAETGAYHAPYGATCCFLHDSGRHCGEPAESGIPWRDDDTLDEHAVWYCTFHFKQMLAADNMLLYLSARIVATPLDEGEL